MVSDGDKASMMLETGQPVFALHTLNSVITSILISESCSHGPPVGIFNQAIDQTILLHTNLQKAIGPNALTQTGAESLETAREQTSVAWYFNL